MSDKINWGVIGAGGIADRRTIPEGIVPCELAELIAVQDTDADRLATVGDKYGIANRYNTAEQLLGNPHVDAVYIATPTNLHHEHVVAAAKAGKHILCEKPLGLTPEDCESMIEACMATDVKLGVNFMMRFHPVHELLGSLVEEGRLGQLVMGKAELSCWYPPIPDAFRQDPKLGGGGAFIDMASHCVDLLEQYFGPVTAVTGLKSNLVQPYSSEDTAAALLEFGSGAIGMVSALFNIPDTAAYNQLLVYGSEGRASSVGTIGQSSAGELNWVIPPPADYDASQDRPLDNDKHSVQPIPGNMYERHIRAFSQALTGGTEPPIPGKAGLHSAKVVTAFYVACRDSRTVVL